MSSSSYVRTTLLLCLGLHACGDDAPSRGAIDAGAQLDAATRLDAGNADAGALDAARLFDAAHVNDAAAPREDAARVDHADTTGVKATSASKFLSSIGVCTHVAQGVDDPTRSAAAMQFAGIRNLRDDGRPSAVASWLAMHQSAGVRVALLTNQDVSSTLDMAKQLRAADALLALEGPNEPNNFPVTYQGQKSDSSKTFVPVAYLQRDLYAAVKAEPMLQGIPVFHASEAGGSEPDDVGLQFLTIPQGAKLALPDGTQYADFANTHNYVCGHSSKLVDNVAWNASDAVLNGDWDGLYVEYGHTWHGGFMGYTNAALRTLPRVTTETGWVTRGNGAISEEQQARLFLNLYLAAYAQGISYTFIYMLHDDPGQGYWGLFATDYTPKKSGTYLHNLTTILDDDGTAAEEALDFAIASPPATLHSLLLQKTDSSFALVLWNERPSGGQDDVVVDLRRVRPEVRVFDPTVGTDAMQTLQNVQTVNLTLSDHPLVLIL